MKKSLFTKFDVGFWAGLLSTGFLSTIDKILSSNSTINFVISIAICFVTIITGQYTAKEFYMNKKLNLFLDIGIF
jgi:hypothetical protein